MPLAKRIFDLIVVILTIPIWLPFLAILGLALMLSGEWPIIYLSKRYVRQGKNKTVFKFRTMIKNADQVANRDTVEHDPDTILHIHIDDALYTPVGKIIDRFNFTELPQLFQVLTGTLSLVGGRPLPERMLNLARESYPYIDEVLTVPRGITGPSQLVGREKLKDKERIKLELTYAYICREAYTPLIDLTFLTVTVLLTLRLVRNISIDQMLGWMYRATPKSKLELIKQQVEETMAG